MKRILFVVGPALGHAARTINLARWLRRRGFEVNFASANTLNLTGEVVEPEFPLHILASAFGEDDGVAFATALTNCVETLSPDILCYDLTPLPWLIQLPRFPVPEVYITNAFLTRLGKHKTYQDDLLAEKAILWNRRREQRGLAPMTDSRALYERDLVLLADPPELVANLILPDHYRVIGPCSWEPCIEIPDEVRPLKNILYIAMGSTGLRILPEAFVRRLAEELDCPHIVGLEGKALPPNLTSYVYARLPGGQVLDHARFALTQGGTGSVYQALERGVPVGCWPTHENHRAFGRWMAERGLTVMFEPEVWDTGISGLAERLPQLAARARKLAHSLETLDSGFEASTHIEALLTSSAEG